jgi:hypothetical protein
MGLNVTNDADRNLVSGEDTSNFVLKTSPKALSSLTDAWTTTTYNAFFGSATTAQLVKATSGRVKRARACNGAKITGFYFNMYDSATAAPSGTLAVESMWIPGTLTGSAGEFFFGDSGRAFVNGIGVGASTSPDMHVAIATNIAVASIEWA